MALEMRAVPRFLVAVVMIFLPQMIAADDLAVGIIEHDAHRHLIDDLGDIVTRLALGICVRLFSVHWTSSIPAAESPPT